MPLLSGPLLWLALALSLSLAGVELVSTITPSDYQGSSNPPEIFQAP